MNNVIVKTCTVCILEKANFIGIGNVTYYLFKSVQNIDNI